MAGTPMKAVARRCSMASSTSSGRKCGRKQVGMPAVARPSSVTKPMMWATGRLMTASSRRSGPGQAAPEATWPTSARWVSSAPLGAPVVPEV